MRVFRGVVMGISLLAGAVGPAFCTSTYKMDFSDYTPRNAAIRSALLPGWGQWFNSEHQKGTILGGATLAAIGAAAYLFIDSHSLYNQYTAKGVPDDPIYNQYRNERTAAFIAVGVGAIGYVGGILDAYVTARRRGSSVSKLEYLHFAMDAQGRTAVSYDIPF